MNAVSTSNARKSLLGLIEDSLTAGERDALEQEFFEQDDLFEELLAAEDELVDDLVAGRLSADTKATLEQRPALVPGLKVRATLSRKLSQLAAERGEGEFRESQQAVSQPRPRQRFRSWLAAAALLALAVGPWLWWRSQTAAPDVGLDPHMTWVLSASSSRGAALPQLHLPPGGSVTLILELDQPLQGTPGSLRGTLTDGRGTVRKLRSELRVETFPWGIGVEVMLPKDAWRKGINTIELGVVRTDGTVELVAIYYFELLQY